MARPEQLQMYLKELEINPLSLRSIVGKMNETDDIEGLYDLLGVSTKGGLNLFQFFTPGEVILGEQTMYGATPLSMVRDALEVVQPGPESVFMDLGSGEGGVVFYTALAYDIPSTGIEIVERRVKKADEIKERYGIENATFIYGKAQKQNLLAGNIFFMYDALSNETLDEVREKLRVVATIKPIYVIFHWILEERLEILQKRNWLERVIDPRLDKHTHLAVFKSKN